MARIRPLARAGADVLAAVVAAVIAVLAPAGEARAQGAGSRPRDGASDDLTMLERSLAEQHDALSTSDCAAACRALASIRRAADKICALDPGDRCAAGRAKADDATRRVHEACPECAIASAPTEMKPRPEDRAMTKGGAKPAQAAEPPAPSPGTESAQSGPPSESKRGGCAGCTTATRTSTSSDVASGALAALALALAARRRRRR